MVAPPDRGVRGCLATALGLATPVLTQRQPSLTLINSLAIVFEARNELGTPGVAKSFLKGPHVLNYVQ